MSEINELNFGQVINAGICRIMILNIYHKSLVVIC